MRITERYKLKINKKLSKVQTRITTTTDWNMKIKKHKEVSNLKSFQCKIITEFKSKLIEITKKSTKS